MPMPPHPIVEVLQDIRDDFLRLAKLHREYGQEDMAVDAEQTAHDYLLVIEGRDSELVDEPA